MKTKKRIKRQKISIIVGILILTVLTGCTQKEIQELKEEITEYNTQVEETYKEENKNKEAMQEYKAVVTSGLQGETTPEDKELKKALEKIQRKIMESVEISERIDLLQEQDEGLWQDEKEAEKEITKRTEKEYTRVVYNVDYSEYTSTSQGDVLQEFLYNVRGLRQAEKIGLEIRWVGGEIQTIEVIKIGG